MNTKSLAIAAMTLLGLELVGFPASGLLGLLGVLGVALAGVLLTVGAEAEAGRAFAGGLGAILGSSFLAALGGAAAPTGAPAGSVVLGVACLGAPLLALGGLHLVARGLASLPDRPPPARPHEWRRAEVQAPGDRPQEPGRRRASGSDDLDLFRGGGQ
jgi:hypothetical protein